MAKRRWLHAIVAGSGAGTGLSLRMIKSSLALFLLLVAPAQAEFATPWAPSARSAARLIAAGGLHDGVYRVGTEIRLNPKTVTYWRNPGDAGAPPVFSFAQSQNVAEAKVQYPAPRRIAEAGGVEAFGYEVGVVFPVLVTPLDPALPVVLDLALKYAACERICVPAEAKLHLDLAPQAQDGEFAEKIAAALARVPVAATLAAGGIAPVAGAIKPSWLVTSQKMIGQTPPQGAFTKGLLQELDPADMFAEAPAGWYFDTRPGDRPGQFLLILAERPRDTAIPSVTVRLTLTGLGSASETEATLDVGAPKP